MGKGNAKCSRQNDDVKIIMEHFVVVHGALFPLHAVVVHLHAQFLIETFERFLGAFLCEWVLWEQNGGDEQAVVGEYPQLDRRL